MRTLNLGILAHVDAGKTSLTERLLHAAGAIDDVGRVDDGSTRTDSLALERARGITIKSAVVSFVVDDVAVNLIDTPGHPDFIAEVERVLNVLDGAVLVVSAVEGVQPQTRVLMRTLQRLRIPTLVFVNKIDRAGARPERIVRDLRDTLSPACVPMGSVADAGTGSARFAPYDAADESFTATLLDTLTGNDDALLAEYVDDEATVSYPRLCRELAAQTGRAQLHPVYAGSAVTGAGVGDLVAGVTGVLPATEGDADGPLSATVFKVERAAGGGKIAYVRVSSGTLRVRDRVPMRDGREAKVTAVRVFDRGAAVPHDAVVAGRIGTVHGLDDVRIGDTIGTPAAAPARDRQFSPPTLETVVVPGSHTDKTALHTALTQLAEQDPLIDLRQDDLRREVCVSLYGEVQKEVIQATLAGEYGLEVTFRESTTLFIERPVGTGSAVETIGADDNPFRATVGLRVEPAPVDSGVRFRLGIERGSLPPSFVKAVEETVRRTLDQGLHGWRVTDCTVTLTDSAYTPPPPTGWSAISTSAGDFRQLTPLVLMSALRRAGTRVHEPMHRFRLEVPDDVYGTVLPALARLRAVPGAAEAQGRTFVVDGTVPAATTDELQRLLPSLTHGDGVLECGFDHYQPVSGPPPTRPRTDHNPLDRNEYLLRLAHRLDNTG